jgi:hypothetical protein
VGDALSGLDGRVPAAEVDVPGALRRGAALGDRDLRAPEVEGRLDRISAYIALS